VPSCSKQLPLSNVARLIVSNLESRHPLNVAATSSCELLDQATVINEAAEMLAAPRKALLHTRLIHVLLVAICQAYISRQTLERS
jgi:hypothetical protein